MKNFIKIFAFLIVITVVPFLTSQSTAKAAEKVDLPDYAKKFIGVPYAWGGTTPKGFDCSGFMTYVFKGYGIQLPRTSADQFYQGQKISKEKMVPGDLVFFTTYKAGPSHSGIYIGNDKFIHASPHGVEIASLKMNYYSSRYLGARRFIQPEQVKSMNTTLSPKSTKKGKLGVVYIKKKINLWKRDKNNKLKIVRVLKPGEKYQVYDMDRLYGGQFNLGSNLFVTNIGKYVKYIPA